jgi:Mn2+/Fe2+ NRAMP family transporter
VTGVIGFFVVVTCAATLHVRGLTITSAADAASALEPLAGSLARALFAIGIIGAAILAAAIVPLSTAYSLCEFIGHEGAINDGFRRAPFFYGSYLCVAGVALCAVLLPGISLIPVLVLTQVLNAVLLLPLLLFMYGLARDPDLMGGHHARRVDRPLPRDHRSSHHLHRSPVRTHPSLTTFALGQASPCPRRSGHSE